MAQKDQELDDAQLSRQLRDAQRSFQDRRFTNEHSAEIQRDIPKAEKFTREFADKFLRPLTLEENNPYLEKLEITNPDDLAIIKIINDALILDKANQLSAVTSQSEVGGYDPKQNTSNFSHNMMFLRFHSNVGTNPIIGLADKFIESASEYVVGTTAESLDPRITKMINLNGQIFSKQRPGAENSTTELSEEMIEADKSDYQVSINMAWDLDNSRPAYIILSGNKGLIGKSFSLRFSFESDVPGATPFPIKPLGAEKSQVKFNPDHTELNESYEGSIDDIKNHHAWTEKSVKLGEFRYDNETLSVWGNNSNWGTFKFVNRKQE